MGPKGVLNPSILSGDAVATLKSATCYLGYWNLNAGGHIWMSGVRCVE